MRKTAQRKSLAVSSFPGRRGPSQPGRRGPCALATSLSLIITIASCFVAHAAPPPASCAQADRACLLARLETLAATIPEAPWRDRTCRELAKTLAFEGQFAGALAQIGKIDNPDTRAMAIRGVGMAAAERKTPPEARVKLFTALRAEADKIDHKPSQAIAMTYIAMAQAFAGDDDAARKTANEMENAALRHKAFGETAEIQAERGDLAQVHKSLSAIDNEAYRAKSSLTVVKILARAGLFDAATQIVQTIANPTLQTEGLQFILDRQVPREAPRDNLLHEPQESAAP